MTIDLYPAPEVLKNYVEYFWTGNHAREETTPREITSFVNGASGILFQHHNGNSAFVGSAACSGQDIQTDTLPNAYAYGQITQPNLILAKGPFSAAGVIMKPHAWHALFEISATELTERRIGLNEFSTEDLTERLLNETRQQAHVALLRDFLISRLQHMTQADLLVQEGVRLIHHNIRSVKVMHLLKKLEISERQFERRFRQAIGLSPYFYIRAIRFQEALKLLQSQQFKRLSDIAFALNFADQSHFIKDIKEFSGITPKSLAQKVGDFIHHDIGYFR